MHSYRIRNMTDSNLYLWLAEIGYLSKEVHSTRVLGPISPRDMSFLVSGSIFHLIVSSCSENLNSAISGMCLFHLSRQLIEAMNIVCRTEPVQWLD